MKIRFWVRYTCGLAALFLSSVQPAAAQQTIQLLNANSDNYNDNEVWVLFQAANADVEANGKPISGVANLSLPIGTVTTAAAAGASTVTSTSFQNLSSKLGNMPATPFPITFLSGANTGTTAKVTSYSSGTGVFTLSSALAKAQTTSDQFVVGGYSQKLSSLPKAGYKLQSPLSGESHTVYEVTANTLNSGVIYISYGQLTYASGAPAILNATAPYQTVELTTGGATTSDLTVIDYFAIPLQIESVSDAGQNDEEVLDVRTFYFNLDKIQTDIEALGATLNNKALYLGPGQEASTSSTGNPRPFPSFNSYLSSLEGKKFTISGTQNFGTATPDIVYGITLAENYGAKYDYTTKITEKDGNYLVTLNPGKANGFYNIGTGQRIPTPENFPDPSDVESITISLPKGKKGVVGYDQIIYGAVLSAESFQINVKGKGKSDVPVPLPAVNPSSATITQTNTNSAFQSAPLTGQNFIAPFNITFTSGANAGTTSTVVTVDNSGNMTLQQALANAPVAGDAFTISVSYDNVFTQIYTNSIYSWVVSNFLAGMNFGFPDGQNAGDSSAAWFAGFPQQFPYGVARGTVNDGFYNPWAAYFYNASDAYGFAFSDRVAPSPLMSTNSGDVFRVTVLPESQINAPLLSVTDTENDSLTVTWPADPNVTYTIEVEPPPSEPITQSTTSGVATAVVQGLQPGTPYTFFVQGSNASTNQTSLILPYTATTSGNVTELTTGFELSVAFTWGGGAAAPYPAEADKIIYVSGVASQPMTGDNTDYTTNPNNVSIYGAPGSNLFVLEIKTAGATPQTIFKAPFQVDLETVTNGFSLSDTPQLFGQGAGSTISGASGTWGQPIAGGGTTQLPITITYVPATTKEFAAVEEPQTKTGKADLSVGKDTASFRGQHRYNKSGKDQEIETFLKRGESESFYFRLNSRSKNRNSYRLYANHAGDHSFDIRYFIGGKEVTDRLIAKEGLLVGGMQRGEWATIRAEVTAKENAGDGAKLSIQMSANPHRRRQSQDVVRLGVTVK